ncbi:MAG: hypothetical protein ABJM43_14050 [Paracoccaceae bacterium]
MRDHFQERHGGSTVLPPLFAKSEKDPNTVNQKGIAFASGSSADETAIGELLTVVGELAQIPVCILIARLRCRRAGRHLLVHAQRLSIQARNVNNGQAFRKLAACRIFFFAEDPTDGFERYSNSL